MLADLNEVLGAAKRGKIFCRCVQYSKCVVYYSADTGGLKLNVHR